MLKAEKDREHLVRATVLENVLVRQVSRHLPNGTDPRRVVRHFFLSDAEVRNTNLQLVKEGFGGADVIKLRDLILKKLRDQSPKLH